MLKQAHLRTPISPIGSSRGCSRGSSCSQGGAGQSVSIAVFAANTHRLRNRLQRPTALTGDSAAVEQLYVLRPSLEVAIERGLRNCLTETSLALGSCKTGKVRDTYDLGDKLAIVTTDRQSAFDRLLASVPYKGQVLNQVSAWWMERTQHITPNAMLAVPDPNISVMEKCTVFQVEFVVRGFLTGSTSTSVWTHYARGERQYCGNLLPQGMRKNDRSGLDRNNRLHPSILTPTTKADDHDAPISAQEVVNRGLMSASEWKEVHQRCLDLFAFGQAEALERGLLLVDTKYEFGKRPDGTILLVDEIHTPDSSRYWIADSYDERHAAGDEPQSIDKEFLRLWFRQQCDPYRDKVLPEAPPELVIELSRRYITLFEMITGKEFEPAPSTEPQAARIAKNLAAWSAGL